MKENHSFSYVILTIFIIVSVKNTYEFHEAMYKKTSSSENRYINGRYRTDVMDPRI